MNLVNTNIHWFLFCTWIYNNRPKTRSKQTRLKIMLFNNSDLKQVRLLASPYYVIIFLSHFCHCIKLPFVSVALIFLVLHLTKIFLLKIFIFHCLVPLNSILFKPCLLLFNKTRQYNKKKNSIKLSFQV